MNTVVFGDDGSPSSDLAFTWIDSQTWPGWRLQVLHAEAPPFGKPIPDEEVEPHPWVGPHPRTVGERTAFAAVEQLLARADPRTALLAPADLLVIGPRGHGMLKSLSLGSVSEWLLSHPPSPLVIARTGGTVARVLVAHDGSRSADLALRTFASLPWATSTTCTAVIVDDGRVDVDATTRAVHKVLEPEGIAAEIVRRGGSPTAALAKEIDRRTPDLTVLGTRGHTGLHRIHLGSTVSAIARTASCSALVACADDTHPSTPPSVDNGKHPTGRSRADHQKAPLGALDPA